MKDERFRNKINEEMAHIKTHPSRGFDICAPLKSLEPCLPIIRSHHERMDGQGYPDGLKGEEILLEARIVAVAEKLVPLLATWHDTSTPAFSSARVIALRSAGGVVRLVRRIFASAST